MGIADDLQGLAGRLVEPLRGWLQSAMTGDEWTPSLQGSATAGSFTYDRRTGAYRRIGDLVWVGFRIRVLTIPTPAAGALQITGLPFTPLASGDLSGYGIAPAYYSSLNLAPGAVQVSLSALSTGVIQAFEGYDNAAVTSVDAALLSAGSDISASGWFLTS